MVSEDGEWLVVGDASNVRGDERSLQEVAEVQPWFCAPALMAPVPTASYNAALDTLYVHADESCLGNQFQTRANPGGAAGLVELWKDGAWERRDYWISEPDATNNRMAIRSGIEVLTSLTRRHRVYFVSDSQYLVNGINEWMPGWKKASWKRKAGPIKNLELWRSLDKQLQGHDLTAHWVRGHAGHPENEYVDFLATRAAKEQTRSSGLIESAFADWLDAVRGKGKYLDYLEFQPPQERYQLD